MRAASKPLLLSFALVAGALAGCLGGGDEPGPNRTLDPLQDIMEDSQPSEPVTEWPPCHLVPGEIAFPAFPPAAPPIGPVDVVIKRDAYGVAHIYADDLYSLWYANGYVQAQDRLFQMDILRQVGYGESAKHLGAGQLGLDFEVHRTLYTKDEIALQWATAPPEGKQAVQAYADGVNRFMAEAVAQDSLPGEFAAVGRVPPPWSPLDTIALVNYLIGFFGVSGGHELSNLRTLADLRDSLGPEAAWDAFGDWVWLRADDTYTSIHPDDLILNGCEDPLAFDAAAAQFALADAARGAATFGALGDGQVGVADLPWPLTGLPGSYERELDHGIMEGFQWGSNALVVDGGLTSTGSPMMWGAPQMSYYKPPVPYQVGLHAPNLGIDAVGIGVSGAPGLVIGRNADIAWTATSGIEDQVDFVSLELTGDGTYLWDGQEKVMDCWIVDHQTFPAPADVAGLVADPPNPPSLPMVYEQEVCRAEGWPVMAINEEAGYAWLAKYSTRGEELIGALIWLQIPFLSSIGEFREHVGDFPFTFNYLVASHDGVAQIHTGDVPIRAPGYDPRLPAPPGSAFDWRGEAYTAEMGTWVTDPTRGYIANWNNAPVYGWRAGDLPALWGPAHRVQQIEYWIHQELAVDGTLDLQDIRDINWMAATHDSYALPFLPMLIDSARSDPDLVPLADELAAWLTLGAPWRDDNGDGLYDDPAHAIWDFMFRDMFARITGDEMGDSAIEPELEPGPAANGSDHGTHTNHLAPIMKMLRGETAHDWCDDVRTDGHETCLDMLVAGLREAKTNLTERFGPEVATWLEPVHMNRFVAFGAFTADERPMVNRGSWVQTVSMAESALSGSVLPPTNTGLVTPLELAMYVATGVEPSRVTMELDLYWNNEYKPFPLTTEEVASVAVVETSLTVFPPPLPIPLI